MADLSMRSLYSSPSAGTASRRILRRYPTHSTAVDTDSKISFLALIRSVVELSDTVNAQTRFEHATSHCGGTGGRSVRGRVGFTCGDRRPRLTGHLGGHLPHRPSRRPDHWLVASALGLLT